MTRTLLLDLDGTLVDTVPDLAAALNRLLAARALPFCDHGQVAAMVGDGVAALVAKAFAAQGLKPDEADIAAFTADYQAHVADQSCLYPGVRQVLAELAGQGWRLAVCTNKPLAAARALLDTLGILPFFGAIGAGDSFPMRKPDPAHLLATLAAVSGTPPRAVMLGDHRNDVTASVAAGVACIFASWGYGTPEMATGSAAVAQDIASAAAIANRLLPVD